MQEQDFRHWLESLKDSIFEALSKDTIRTYLANAKRVEQHYGDLDVLYIADNFESFLLDPSRIPTSKDSLLPYKTAIRCYRDFLDERLRERLNLSD